MFDSAFQGPYSIIGGIIDGPNKRLSRLDRRGENQQKKDLSRDLLIILFHLKYINRKATTIEMVPVKDLLFFGNASGDPQRKQGDDAEKSEDARDDDDVERVDERFVRRQ